MADYTPTEYVLQQWQKLKNRKEYMDVVRSISGEIANDGSARYSKEWCDARDASGQTWALAQFLEINPRR